MKIKIKENSITIDDAMEALKEKFGNKYQVKLRQKGIIAVAKSKTCSANVFPLKNKLIINGGFPTMLGQMGFTVSVVALGVIPPLLVYFLVFNKKMKAIEKEVGEFLKEKYNDKIMKTNLILMLLSLFLLSCASDNEKKTLDEVAKIYNATTSYSKNFNSSAGHKTIKEFNIKVSDSKMLDTLPKGAAASNIAMVTYNNWNDDEKKDYTAINVSLISKKKDTTSLKYDIPVLKSISQKTKVFNIFSENLVKKDFSTLDTYKDNKSIPQSLSAFTQKHLAKLEKSYGAIQHYKPILIITEKNGEKIEFVGIIDFKSGKKIKYYLVFYSTNDKIQGIHFI